MQLRLYALVNLQNGIVATMKTAAAGGGEREYVLHFLSGDVARARSPPRICLNGQFVASASGTVETTSGTPAVLVTWSEGGGWSYNFVEVEPAEARLPRLPN